jgi:hypothetical protein
MATQHVYNSSTQLGKDHVATRLLLVLGTNTQPSEPKLTKAYKQILARLAAYATPVRPMAYAGQTGGQCRSGRWLQQLHNKCSRELQ